MPWKILTGGYGSQPIGELSTTKRHPIGTEIEAEHETYGAGTFWYGNGAAGVVLGSWCKLEDDYADPLLRTSTPGRLAVAMSPMTEDDYGWFQVRGTCVAKSTDMLDNNIPHASAVAGEVKRLADTGYPINGAISASNQDTPSAGLALFEIDRPTFRQSVNMQSGVNSLTDNTGGVDPLDGIVATITQAANAGSADVGPVAAAFAQILQRQNQLLVELRRATVIDPG